MNTLSSLSFMNALSPLISLRRPGGESGLYAEADFFLTVFFFLVAIIRFIYLKEFSFFLIDLQICIRLDLTPGCFSNDSLLCMPFPWQPTRTEKQRGIRRKMEGARVDGG